MNEISYTLEACTVLAEKNILWYYSSSFRPFHESQFWANPGQSARQHCQQETKRVLYLNITIYNQTFDTISQVTLQTSLQYASVPKYNYIKSYIWHNQASSIVNKWPKRPECPSLPVCGQGWVTWSLFQMPPILHHHLTGWPWSTPYWGTVMPSHRLEPWGLRWVRSSF